MELRAIGTVSSELTDPAAAPKQGTEAAPDAWIEFESEFAEGLADLSSGDAVIVLTWLDRADRSMLAVHPQDNPSNPLTGVFSTRSADRPNPVGLHQTEVLEVDGTRVKVARLEAVDGTPVIDLKPVI